MGSKGSARLGHAIVAILLYSVATVWVPQRWALSGLQAATLLCAAVLSWRAAAAGRRLDGGFFLIPLIGMFLLSLTQLALHWTEVPAETADAALFWLTASCLSWIAWRACRGSQDRERFLHSVLVAGSAVALLGIVQLYTARGKVFWMFPSGYDTLVIGPFVSPNNYAAFVELLVPLALVSALRNQGRSPAYLAVAAALVASVIASGSRAGVFLVAAESAVVLLVYPVSHGGIRRRALAVFLGFAVAFTAVVGYRFLWGRVAHTGDLYLVRREFMESSLAMFRARSTRGFGLGAWPWVYPRFAVIDIGAFANHAHNEWIQWAAEGGIPALLLMLALLAWTVRAAIRTGWGIGVLAVMIHSLVDYPFLRLGSAAWTFALIGALAAHEHRRHGATASMAARPAARLLAAAATGGLVASAGFAVTLAWADTLYRRGTADGITRAIRLAPYRAEYHLAWAEADPPDGVSHLKRALELNPGMTSARLRLAWQQETHGAMDAAERQVLEAARYDRQFLPAWTAANFYFRAGRHEEFWRWARTAAAMSFDDLRGLFSLCFRLTPDAGDVMRRVAGGKRSVERNLLAYLVAEGRLDDATTVAERIAGNPTADDRDALLSYVESAHAGGRPGGARAVWESMCRRQLLPDRPGGTNLLANGDFEHNLTQRGFDWHALSVGGVRIGWDGRGVPALRIDLSGQQPERCELLTHPLVAEEDASYVLRCRYRTAGIPASSGLFWSLGEGRELPLDGSEEWQSAECRFRSLRQAEQLSLRYLRAPGTTRIEGSLTLSNVTIERENLRPEAGL